MHLDPHVEGRSEVMSNYLCFRPKRPNSGAVEGQDPARERQVDVSYQYTHELFTVALARRSADHNSALFHPPCTFRKHPVVGTVRHTSQQPEQCRHVLDLTLIFFCGWLACHSVVHGREVLVDNALRAHHSIRLVFCGTIIKLHIVFTVVHMLMQLVRCLRSGSR